MNNILILIFIQIVAESLPISSSTHLTIAEHFISCFNIVNTFELPNFFDHFLHGPTVLILIIFFRKEYLATLKILTSRMYGYLFIKRTTHIFDSTKKVSAIIFKIIALTITSCSMTALWYGFVNIILKKSTLCTNPAVTIVGLCITALSLLSLKIKSKTNEKFNLKKAMILGFVQGLALLPGISRLATTYATARLLKINHRRAFQISFLISFPLFVAGFSINGVLNLLKTPNWITLFPMNVVAMFIVSTIIAYVLLWWVHRLTQKNKLWIFSFYMIVPIVALLFTVFSSPLLNTNR